MLFLFPCHLSTFKATICTPKEPGYIGFPEVNWHKQILVGRQCDCWLCPRLSLCKPQWWWFWFRFPGEPCLHLNGNFNAHLFSCDQAAPWMVQAGRLSVCLSVRPSVCLSHLFDYVPIIVSSWNFRELLPVTKVTSMQKVKVRGKKSRSQRSQPNLTVSGL